MSATARTKTYFISDLHLGVPNAAMSRQREKAAVRFLNQIAHDAKRLYVLGDLFDFWYEYATVVPKGFVRIQGKLAEMADQGVEVHLFTGNHDMWMFNYFTDEFGATVHRSPEVTNIDGTLFMLGHGDGLGPGDHGYKFIKKVFANPISIWLFGKLPPGIGVRLAHFWSGRSREANLPQDEVFKGLDNEWLYLHCRDVIRNRQAKNLQPIANFIFGHRHLLLDIDIDGHARYINLGEWFSKPHFAVWDGKLLEIKPIIT